MTKLNAKEAYKLFWQMRECKHPKRISNRSYTWCMDCGVFREGAITGLWRFPRLQGREEAQQHAFMMPRETYESLIEMAELFTEKESTDNETRIQIRDRKFDVIPSDDVDELREVLYRLLKLVPDQGVTR